ncbi:hypothetical protein PFLUV_G00185460 [Perca fluviatilis]|uniref:C1q domain-containing protein n=1 Tax=Perca fluviatilis TaxID=8168 RepID=A0A6A5EB38_PERFL|nr:complement C1q-like protein 4 [Perca fluviatilis]KAF1378040.1 hypothetical protein PFLUV_G00185460 [Perca fluviatilis]
MKISVSFTLWLLLGSVYASEGVEIKPASPPDINAALREITASLAQLKADMMLLQRETTVRQVAFSASLVAGVEPGESVTTGPFPSFTTLIFKHVPTNIGNAYNSTTGVFTAPVRGAYHFEWWVAAFGDNGAHASGAALVKNSENIFTAWEQRKEYLGTASNGVTLLLEVGDVVSVSLWADTVAFDNANHHTTFSGHLLFPM